MPARLDVVKLALTFDGVKDGAGYDGENPFSTDLGRPAEAWCGDYYTDMFKRAGVPLPSMQPGCKTGFAYVPDAWALAQKKGATRPSWEAQPGDAVIFGGPGWNPKVRPGFPCHVELFEKRDGNDAHTIGGNSGASNENQFRGRGGVHQHIWRAPAGVGNDLIIGVIDISKFVVFGAAAKVTAPATPKPADAPRELMVKSPMMSGPDVLAVQNALRKRGFKIAADSVYGPETRAAVISAQRNAHLAGDGIVGPNTRKLLGI